MTVEHPVTSPDERLIAEADDFAVQFYEIGCDDLNPAHGTS